MYPRLYSQSKAGLKEEELAVRSAELAHATAVVESITHKEARAQIREHLALSSCCPATPSALLRLPAPQGSQDAPAAASDAGQPPPATAAARSWKAGLALRADHRAVLQQHVHSIQRAGQQLTQEKEQEKVGRVCVLQAARAARMRVERCRWELRCMHG